MDGVVYRGKHIIPGAKEFVSRMIETDTKFLFLTNNSEQTPIDLMRKLEDMGIHGLTENNFITSAMATADFLKSQKPGGTAYVIGGAGMANELYNAGFSLTDNKPDYVVVGKTSSFNFEMLRKAVHFINNGAKFIGTNPDVVDPMEGGGSEPACGSILASIEIATGKKPYVVGKPNPLMMISALKKIGTHADNTIMIGDRMDTDMLAGLEAGMTTCLVLSGVSSLESIENFPYKPNHIFNNIGEIYPEKL